MHITKFQYLRITYPWIEKSAKETFSFKLKKKDKYIRLCTLFYPIQNSMKFCIDKKFSVCIYEKQLVIISKVIIN